MVWRRCFWFCKVLTSGPEACSTECQAFTPMFEKRWSDSQQSRKTSGVCVLTCPWGSCWEQQAYSLSDSISLWKTCCFRLDANQEPIKQSSLTEQGQGGKGVSCHHVFEEEKETRGELNSVIGTSLEGCFLNLKVWCSNQQHKLEASDLHGLTGVGHNLLTGQWHHWGFEGNFDSSSFLLDHAAIMLFYCERGSLTYKAKLVI